MSDDTKDSPTPSDASPLGNEDGDAILARRNRFIAAAMATLASASILGACSEPEACLKMSVPYDGDASKGDATPQACLSAVRPDTGPGDTGPADAITPDATSDAADASDAPPDAPPDAAAD